MKQNTEETEEMLVRLSSDGDLEAFNQLVLLYQDTVYHHAWSIIQDPDVAADVAQESFIKAYRAIGRFRGGSFRAWLLRIVTNTAYDEYRRYKRKPTQPLFPEDDEGEALESPAWIVDDSPSVPEMFERTASANQIYRLLNELPDIYRLVITLVDIYDMDYTEAAQTLGVPLGTVKSRLLRARLQMRKKLISSKDVSLPEKYNTGAQLPA